MKRRYRIGIDLGTTNCALAWTAMDDPTGTTRVLEIPQQETEHSRLLAETLPSFLHQPPGSGDWIGGRWAREQALQTPGRVVHSAKSWLIHHGADRHAPFLPLEADGEGRLSPVGALALLLRQLVASWDAALPDYPLAEQEVAITVPASFDPLAQQLTLEAAQEAGLGGAILLEEPQAAFYAWLATQGEAFARGGGKKHVLVVDLGGGTTDFSLFAVEGGEEPHLQRIAVSPHLLLGGDNLDLALAHHLEARLANGGDLPPGAFARLLAQCRRIKEEALSEPYGSERLWPVAVALPGKSLLAGTLRTEVSAREIARLLLEGFFPESGARERPETGGSGLREIGLPYAKDPAVTRHLAAFLQGQPKVDALLCNGGLTKAAEIRARLLEHLTRWQGGEAPELLENREPDLAVARGAARFLHLRAMNDPSQIESGSASACYIGVGGGKALCLLPQGGAVETSFEAQTKGLTALVGKPARFPLHRHLRRPQDKAGDLLVLDDDFLEMPPVETLLSLPEGVKVPENPRVRVRLRTTLRATGLLRVELLSAEPKLKWDQPWPLEFSLRSSATAAPSSKASATAADRQLPIKPVLEAFAKALRAGSTRQKVTGNALLSAAENLLGSPRTSWNGLLVRELFDGWLTLAEERRRSADHEETWLQVAGYLLRPGIGMPGDPERVDALWPVLGSASLVPRKSVRLQRWICGRRLAPGLDATRSSTLWNDAAAEWREEATPSAEIALLAGALEALPVETRTALAHRLTSALESEPDQSAFWRGLGRLLSRALFHAGTGQVIPPQEVATLWERLRRLEVSDSIRPEATNALLRAGRLTGLRPLDLPKETRKKIDDHLRRWGVTEVRRHPLHEVVPLVVAEQSTLLGESLPPGLTLEG